MNPVVGEPLNLALGDQISHVSTGEPVVSNRVLEMCGIDATAGCAAPQKAMGSGIADLIAKPKPLGLG